MYIFSFKIIVIIIIIFFVALGFELRASHLLCRCSYHLSHSANLDYCNSYRSQCCDSYKIGLTIILTLTECKTTIFPNLPSCEFANKLNF
jgi:hypothetical protein